MPPSPAFTRETDREHLDGRDHAEADEAPRNPQGAHRQRLPSDRERAEVGTRSAGAARTWQVSLGVCSCQGEK